MSGGDPRRLAALLRLCRPVVDEIVVALDDRVDPTRAAAAIDLADVVVRVPYAPPPELLPRPGNPMPCANVDQGQGPFGPNGPYPALPDVASSPTNPNGLPPTPGIPIAGRPGQVQPDVPGTPVPIAPGPPGARTEPLGPLPGPAPANPAAAPPPAAWGRRHQKPSG